jgi:hypothetical protein
MFPTLLHLSWGEPIYVETCSADARSEAPMAVILKIVVFWCVTLNDLVNRSQRFGGTCCLNLQSSLLEDDGSRFHRNIGIFPPNYKAHYSF